MLSTSVYSNVIVFDADINNTYGIYKSDNAVMNSLTTENADRKPHVSFNGQKIVFQTTRTSSRSNLWLMNIDGSNQTQLTNSGSNEDFDARWSTDDTLITFSAYRPYGTGGRVMLVQSDGSNERELYYRSGHDSYATGFLQNNSRVAFIRQARYFGGNVTLMTVNIDGSSPTEVVNISTLIPESGAILNSIINKEGTKIAFEYRNTNWDSSVYVINIDGSGLKLLENSTSSPLTPNWLSDGRIVYSNINPDTTKRQLLTIGVDGLNKQVLLSDANNSFGYASVVLDSSTNDCWAVYENGNLHIPCVKVKVPLGNDLSFSVDMKYKPLSDPMTFELTGTQPK